MTARDRRLRKVNGSPVAASASPPPALSLPPPPPPPVSAPDDSVRDRRRGRESASLCWPSVAAACGRLGADDGGTSRYRSSTVPRGCASAVVRRCSFTRASVTRSGPGLMTRLDSGMAWRPRKVSLLKRSLSNTSTRTSQPSQSYGVGVSKSSSVTTSSAPVMAGGRMGMSNTPRWCHSGSRHRGTTLVCTVRPTVFTSPSTTPLTGFFRLTHTYAMA